MHCISIVTVIQFDISERAVSDVSLLADRTFYYVFGSHSFPLTIPTLTLASFVVIRKVWHTLYALFAHICVAERQCDAYTLNLNQRSIYKLETDFIVSILVLRWWLFSSSIENYGYLGLHIRRKLHERAASRRRRRRHKKVKQQFLATYQVNA